ncbi:MAG: hypothetical protein JJE13_13720 [Thermoleophilia bacterium]|nr:hypothetical protein [Thermoleophilia bacterium]
MNEDQDRLRQAEQRLDEPDYPESGGRTPGGLTWPIRRFYWAVEKRILWPIGDSFKRFTKTLRYRSPLAYIGATMLLALTAAAIGAAFYFHGEAKNGETTPMVAEVPAETVVAPTIPAPVTPVTPPSDAAPDDTLKGVVPNFDKTSGTAKDSGASGGGVANKSALDPYATVVKPSATPDSPPLKVAHTFAMTFVDYEVGKKGAVEDFEKTATRKLSKELKQDPPRQPSNGDIPKASVMNVVKGDKSGETLEVSVSLLRSGATSELRLALEQQKGKKWLVSEVRG